MVEIGPELFWSESELVEFVGLLCPIIALLEECIVIIVIEVVELEPGLEVSELIFVSAEPFSLIGLVVTLLRGAP